MITCVLFSELSGLVKQNLVKIPNIQLYHQSWYLASIFVHLMLSGTQLGFFLDNLILRFKVFNFLFKNARKVVKTYDVSVKDYFPCEGERRENALSS